MPAPVPAPGRVDLDQLEAARVRHFQLLQQWPITFARTAPGGPEIHQHGVWSEAATTSVSKFSRVTLIMKAASQG